MKLVLNLIPSDALVYPWWGDPYADLHPTNFMLKWPAKLLKDATTPYAINIIKKDLPTLVAALLDL